ncbi:MAG: XRE family transcriptional regulator, partial [Ideonella sp.]|nr:XRE family transcriptional regulator [Ideonella sp.]
MSPAARRHRDLAGGRSHRADPDLQRRLDVLSDTPQEAANLRARAELARALAALVAANGWTQAEAARRCGVTQPRIIDPALMNLN